MENDVLDDTAIARFKDGDKRRTPRATWAKPLFDYMIERENIRRKREAGVPRNLCTDDPIFPTRSFTNVKRAHDRTSRQLMERFYAPNVPGASPGEILFNCGMARWVNKPDSLIFLGWQKQFDPDALIERYEQRPEGAFFGGAYNISNFGLSAEKFDLLCKRVLLPLWRHAEGMMRRTLECRGYGWEYLCRHELAQNVPGYGADFMAKETAQDYIMATGWKPRDLNTFTPIGPGAIRGLNRLRGRPLKAMKSKSQSVRWQLLDEVREVFAVRHEYLPDGFVELELHDIQFCLCELDKYLRAKDAMYREGS